MNLQYLEDRGEAIEGWTTELKIASGVDSRLPQLVNIAPLCKVGQNIIFRLCVMVVLYLLSVIRPSCGDDMIPNISDSPSTRSTT